MRNPGLRDALRAFTEQAAWQLSAETAGGAEVPFDLVEERGSRGAPLYCYRPLTDEFIRNHVGALGRLPTYAAAGRALESLGGLENYLQMRGEARIPADPGERADATLRSFLGRVFEDASEFLFEDERFDRAYAELERTLFESRTLAQVMAPLRGLAIASPEVTLGEGLSLVRFDALADAPREIARLAEPGAEHGEVAALLTSESEPGEPPPLTVARVRFRRLLSALRLFEAGAFQLGPAAWTRIDAGAWQLHSLAGTGRPRGEIILVDPEQEDELRAFCNLIVRRMPRGGELAWALGRFEMGCERVAPFESLTDYLLALRALLEPEGPGSGQLARRLSAICALPADRSALCERVAHAVSLERAVIGGLAPAGTGVDAIVGDLAEYLRTILRDTLCGHLPPDLVRVADDVLEEDAEAAAPGASPTAAAS
jgi:hypothetical protein